MNEETGGTVVYTDITWEVVHRHTSTGMEHRGIMYFGYGIDRATLDQGKHVMFVSAGHDLALVEAHKNDAEMQMAMVIGDYVEKMGASMTRCIKARRGDTIMVGNPCKEIRFK